MNLSLESYLNLYEKEGLCVIPVNSQKIPLVKWKEDYVTKGIKPGEKEFNQWFIEPQIKNNCAIVCGSPSGGVIGIDFEAEQPYLDLFTPEGAKKLESQTMVVNTPHKGVHVWMRETESIPRRDVRICEMPEVDLLGEGGLMTVPPSVVNHLLCDKKPPVCPRTGSSSYEVRGTTFEIMEVKNALSSFIDRATKLKWQIKQNNWTDVKTIAISGITAGKRNQNAFKFARYLIYDLELDLDAAYYELQRINNSRFHPPLNERELRVCFDQAQKYPKTRPIAGEMIID